MISLLFFCNFNSIKVQLELSYGLMTLLIKQNFNSIKVQLELRFVMTITEMRKFQFHKGTIRTEEFSNGDTSSVGISIP